MPLKCYYICRAEQRAGVAGGRICVGVAFSRIRRSLPVSHTEISFLFISLFRSKSRQYFSKASLIEDTIDRQKIITRISTYAYVYRNSKVASDSFLQFCENGSFFVRKGEKEKIAICRSTRTRLRGPIQKIRRAVGIKSSIRTSLRIFFFAFSLSPPPPLSLFFCLNNIYPHTRHSLLNRRVFHRKSFVLAHQRV